jgi:hypothetical protein
MIDNVIRKFEPLKRQEKRQEKSELSSIGLKQQSHRRGDAEPGLVFCPPAIYKPSVVVHRGR